MHKKDKLRIAILTQPFYYTSFPNPSDSVGIVTAQIARRLAKKCNVIVYTPVEGKTLRGKTEFHDGVNYKYVTTLSDRLLHKVINIIPGIFTTKKPKYASTLYYFFYGLKIALALRKHKTNIVHIHNFSQFISIIRVLNPKIKIALHMHCQWLTQLDHEMIEKRLENANLVIGCSEFITVKIRQSFPQLASKCCTVYNGVDNHLFFHKNYQNHADKDKNDIKQLLFVGRVSPEKGVHVLLAALKQVVEYFPQIHLNIVGSIEGCLPKEFIVSLSADEAKVADLISFYTPDPVTGKELSYFEQLQQQISPELANKVKFCGTVPHEKLNTYYQNADIFINSSLSEALGMPILEAMASSLPVIGSKVGGIPEAVLNEKTGFVVEPGDASELAAALLKIFNDDILRMAMGEASYQRAVDLFSWDIIVENLLKNYKQIQLN